MAKLPPIQTLKACPHCGCNSFYVMQRYSGKGPYSRRFDGLVTANPEMYDCLATKADKTAFCDYCGKAVARWDEDADAPHYNKTRPGHYA